MAIGWYGIPGGPPGGVTHDVRNGKPLCGQPHPKAEFQWCASSWDVLMPECRKCRNIIRPEVASHAASLWHQWRTGGRP